jgi:hypothetical protein
MVFLRAHAKRKVPLSPKELRDPFIQSNVRESGWKSVLEPSGFLTFVIEAELRSVERIAEHWRHPFETKIDWLLGKLEEAAAHTAERRRLNAQYHEHEAKRRKRREERRERERIESHKWDGLVELADEWGEARRLRAFIDCLAKLEEADPDPSGRICEWLAWARERIDALDPLAGDTEEFLERLFPPPKSEYELEFGEPEDIDD